MKNLGSILSIIILLHYFIITPFTAIAKNNPCCTTSTSYLKPFDKKASFCCNKQETNEEKSDCTKKQHDCNTCKDCCVLHYNASVIAVLTSSISPDSFDKELSLQTFIYSSSYHFLFRSIVWQPPRF